MQVKKLELFDETEIGISKDDRDPAVKEMRSSLKRIA